MYPRVAPGSPFNISAASWNAMLDAAEDHNLRKLAAKTAGVGLQKPDVSHTLVGASELPAGAVVCWSRSPPESADPLNKWTIAAGAEADGANRFCVAPYGNGEGDDAAAAVVHGYTWALAEIPANTASPPRWWASAGSGYRLRPWSHGRAELLWYPSQDFEQEQDEQFLGLFRLHEETSRVAKATIVSALSASPGTATFPFGTGRAEEVNDSLGLLEGGQLATGVQARFVWAWDASESPKWELLSAKCQDVT